MEIALLQQGGIYEVRSQSGGVYQVDLLDESCTCPDHMRSPPDGCKHLRRVKMDILASRVPRPDGKLPAMCLPVETTDGGVEKPSASPNDSAASGKLFPEQDIQKVREHESALLKAQLVSEMQHREEEMARLDAELQALQFVYDVLRDLGTDDGFDLDAILADEYGPASQL